jgi:hypothetical protein
MVAIQQCMQVVRYAVPGLITALGLAMVFGLLDLRVGGDARIRVTFGAVAILYGVLRMVQVRGKRTRNRTEDEP